MNPQTFGTERVFDSPAFITTAVAVFLVTTFGFVLGFFYFALGPAILVGLALSLVLPFIMRGTTESFITGFLKSLLGLVAGLLCALLAFLVMSLFV
jgi:hypothetical protein